MTLSPSLPLNIPYTRLREGAEGMPISFHRVCVWDIRKKGAGMPLGQAANSLHYSYKVFVTKPLGGWLEHMVQFDCQKTG